jgi:hypothetical protein
MIWYVSTCTKLEKKTHTPNFNITEFIELCRQKNVRYILTKEFEKAMPYFDPKLDLRQVFTMFYDPVNAGNFTNISKEATFGTQPNRIFVLTFLG